MPKPDGFPRKVQLPPASVVRYTPTTSSPLEFSKMAYHVELSDGATAISMRLKLGGKPAELNTKLPEAPV